MAGNGDQVAALLFWGGDIVKRGYMGSVDYSEQSKTMCFLSRRSGHKGVVEGVLAAMNSKGVKATTLNALFGKYPKTVPGGKVVCDAVPLTDDRSWNWFLQGALASCNQGGLVHLYAVAGEGMAGMKIILNICASRGTKCGSTLMAGCFAPAPHWATTASRMNPPWISSPVNKLDSYHADLVKINL
ncbi:unnamed protein product [Cuscuta campestris]|uniref:Uncharacterized protein n=1 Tax=Cuscuta campestris TaxID=132261 RepID=A0A484MCX6_9ASTE|nr:unnamed protein product [Cuscuta campestris]